MPWDSSTIRRHNKSLHGEKAGHAARIANAVLKSSGDDGMALAVAAKWAKQHRARGGSLLPAQRRADGGATERIPPIRPPSALVEKAPAPPPPGYVDTPYGLVPEKNWQTYQAGRASGGPAPQAPIYQTAAPAVNAQGFVPVPQSGTYNLDLTTGAMQPASSSALQRLAQRGLPIKDPNAPPPPSPAQAGLDQLKALGFQLNDWVGGSESGGSGAGENNGGDGGGPGPWRGGRIERAAGGPAPMSMSQATPWWTRSAAHGEEAHPASGLIKGTSGGRQDNVSMNLPAHSHVIPADVVSGWGQGNTDNGAIALQHALSTGPYGMALPKVPTRPPQALSAPRMPKLASGGSSDGIRTLVSHGEVVVSPADVSRIGGGDVEKGHDWLDRCIVDWRKQIIAHQRKLPPPVKE